MDAAGPLLVEFPTWENRGGLPGWRNLLFHGGLVVACVSTVLNMLWNASWLRQGGSPHGMGAEPGLWQHVGPVLVWLFVVATVLGALGKRKARVLMLAWSVSMFFTFQAVYLPQFD